MSKIRKVSISFVAGLAMFPLAVSLLLISQPAGPSYADTVPTPVAVQNQAQPYLYVTFFDGVAHAASTASSAMQLPGYKVLDVQYVIDQGTTNTVTLKLQWSNDNTNWSDGPDVVAANAADADSMIQLVNMGRYVRVYNTVTNANAVTVTVKALAH